MIGGTRFGIKAQHLIEVSHGSGRHYAAEHQADLGDAQHAIDLFDVAFDASVDVVGGGDLTRFQRAGKSAGQSPRDAGDHVIERGRILGTGKVLAVFIAIKRTDPAVDPEMNGLFEAIELGRAVRALMLGDGHA